MNNETAIIALLSLVVLMLGGLLFGQFFLFGRRARVWAPRPAVLGVSQGCNLEPVANALGIEVADLKEQLKTKTLKDLAEEKGLDLTDLRQQMREDCGGRFGLWGRGPRI